MYRRKRSGLYENELPARRFDAFIYAFRAPCQRCMGVCGRILNEKNVARCFLSASSINFTFDNKSRPDQPVNDLSRAGTNCRTQGNGSTVIIGPPGRRFYDGGHGGKGFASSWTTSKRGHTFIPPINNNTTNTPCNLTSHHNPHSPHSAPYDCPAQTHNSHNEHNSHSVPCSCKTSPRTQHPTVPPIIAPALRPMK